MYTPHNINRFDHSSLSICGMKQMQVTDSRDLCGRDLRDFSFEEIAHAFFWILSICRVEVFVVNAVYPATASIFMYIWGFELNVVQNWHRAENWIAFCVHTGEWRPWKLIAFSMKFLVYVSTYYNVLLLIDFVLTTFVRIPHLGLLGRLINTESNSREIPKQCVSFECERLIQG